MSKENTDPVDTLKKFMSAMLNWEIVFHKEQMELIKSGLGNKDSEEKHKKTLASIFEKFSIPDQRGWARLVDLGCGHPPTYDPDRDD
ncbi:RhsIA family immunity protein, partial [Pseudomonas syringae]|nr:RhsIA family immunity protein [Pseudomonas syringae]